MALDTFLATIFICDFHVKSSSKITPRKVASLTRSIEQLLILNARSSVCLFYLGLNRIKLDFLTLI